MFSALTLRCTLALVLAGFHFGAGAATVAGKHPGAIRAAKPKPGAAKVKTAPAKPVAAAKPKPKAAPVAVAKTALAGRVLPVVPPKQPEQAVVFSGLVLNEAGRPLPGATIWITDNPLQIVVSRADGTFSLQLPSNKPVQLSYGCGGFEDLQLVVSQPTTGQLMQTTLVSAHHKPLKRTAPVNVFAAKL